MTRLPAYLLALALALFSFSHSVKAGPVYNFAQPENIIAFLYEIKTLPDSVALENYRTPIQEILSNPTGTLSKKDLAYLHYANGKIYEEEKIYEKALEEFYKAFELAREGNHLIEKGIARMEIGAILLHKNALREAGEHLQGALAILRHTDGTKYVPRAKFLYAKWLTINGNTKEAIHQMADAVEGFNLEAKFEKGAAIALEFGIQLTQLEMFQQAEEFLKAALFYYRMEEADEAMGKTFMALTENKLKAKDFDDAMIYNQQALKIIKGKEQWLLEGKLQWNFAQIFLGMHQPENAKTHLEEALSILKTESIDLESYNLMLAIAETYEKMGLPKKAEKEFRFLALHTPTLAGSFLDRELIEVAGKYETAMKTQAYASEIEKLTREKHMAQKTSWMLVAILILTIVISALAWKVQRIRRKLKIYRARSGKLFSAPGGDQPISKSFWFKV